ncbi:transcription factor FAMA [Mangifera indica]|uniref:transcription factor FAMA n=1 Tax=Mangifera indica TaxID=29780 RepID=UPI001CF9D43D|nr:transcription factor FAMA [Mangifera indica]
MMEKEENYSASFPALDYSLEHHQAHHMKTAQIGQSSGDNNNHGMIDYMLNNPQPQQLQISSGFCSSNSFDKLSFADVMQFADFGPKLSLNQSKINPDEETGIDPVYFLKFPVLNDRLEDQSLMASGESNEESSFKGIDNREDEEARVSENNRSNNLPTEVKNKRKRPRIIKTSEEVESQRMTHIAVERNRRKQMNEHLRVIRSLMPGSYVQRGDQASIIGGVIEFVRELEQLLQCLESQKRRRLMGDSSSMAVQQQASLFPPPLPFPNDQMKIMDFETGLREETAENKSCLADVEVKLLGFDAMIKILSRRRPGQLIKTIAALEDLQFNILHTNITTIEQTVLYSFNVKVASGSRFTAEDIASSVQQIFSFIHANSSYDA